MWPQGSPFAAPFAALGLAILAAPAAAQIHIAPKDPDTFNTRGWDSIVDTDRSPNGDRAKFVAASAEHLSRLLEAKTFAACAIARSRERAVQLLDQAEAGYSGRKLESAEFVGRASACLGTDFKLDPDLLKGAIAEGLIAERAAPPPRPAGGAQVTEFIRSVALPGNLANDPLARSQAAVECRTALAPVAARALIATEPGSPAEQGALAAMNAATPQCDGIAVGGTALSPVFERAFAAQALYHWCNFAAVGD